MKVSASCSEVSGYKRPSSALPDLLPDQSKPLFPPIYQTGRYILLVALLVLLLLQDTRVVRVVIP